MKYKKILLTLVDVMTMTLPVSEPWRVLIILPFKTNNKTKGTKANVIDLNQLM